MNDLERRLTDLLHTGAPEPERIITASEIAGLAQDWRRPDRRRLHVWGVPLLAAAGVFVAVVVPAVVFGHFIRSVTPTSTLVHTPIAASTRAGMPPVTHSRTSPLSTPASPTRSPSSTTTITAGSVATCVTSQLRLTPGLTDGAAGSMYTHFFFANTAGKPCSMIGFPGVSLLNDAGSIVGQPATRVGPEGPSVRLGPGQRAQFILRVGTATRTGCGLPRLSRQVQVYPPDQKVPLRVPFSTGSCYLSVQSVTAAH